MLYLLPGAVASLGGGLLVHTARSWSPNSCGTFFCKWFWNWTSPRPDGMLGHMLQAARAALEGVPFPLLKVGHQFYSTCSVRENLDREEVKRGAV